MIGLLTGVAREIGNGWVVDVNGTGWKIHTVDPLVEGQVVTLIVTTLVKEDSISLYGFKNIDEQRVFEALLKVSGVGSNTALCILKDLGVNGLILAVKSKRVESISKVKGVGSSTATKIVTFFKIPSIASVLDLRKEQEQVLEVLLTLGYNNSEALDVILKVTADNENDLLSESLKLLNSKGAVEVAR